MCAKHRSFPQDRPAQTSTAAAPNRRLTGLRLWLARLFLAVGTPVLLLLALEGTLRLLNSGYPTHLWLFRPEAHVYTDNPRFVWQFYSRKTNLRPTPFSVAAPKPSDAIRLVVLGESAAAGTPEPAFSFSRILERMLRAQYPKARIEVLNAAMRGVNSHILLPAAKDCLKLEPDLFVVYMGNNEVVGLHAPGPHSGRLTPYRPLLRLVQWIRSTRTGELLEPLLQNVNRETIGVENQDDTFFRAHELAADDPRRAAVDRNFQANLQDICRLAQGAGAGVVLATVGSNLKDCPPFGSTHRSGLATAQRAAWDQDYQSGNELESAGRHADALAKYTNALAIDNHYAELHFRTARCLWALGQFSDARTHYIQARDWDALQFRTDSHLNDLIRSSAANLHSDAVRLVDAERALSQSELTAQAVPGAALFRDHVHPTFAGDYELARAMLPAVVACLKGRLGPASSIPPLSQEECAARLGYSRLTEAQLDAGILSVTAQPPFTLQLEHAQRQAAAQSALQARFGNLGQNDLRVAVESFSAAMRLAPDDWQLPFNLGRMLLTMRQPRPAIEQLTSAKHLLPYSAPVRLALSSALASVGRFDDALLELGQAQQLEPWSEAVKTGFASIEQQRQAAASAGSR